MIALVAEMGSMTPHEVALGVRDVPGVRIASACFVFDLQAGTELSKARRAAEAEVQRG